MAMGILHCQHWDVPCFFLRNGACDCWIFPWTHMNQYEHYIVTRTFPNNFGASARRLGRLLLSLCILQLLVQLLKSAMDPGLHQWWRLEDGGILGLVQWKTIHPRTIDGGCISCNKAHHISIVITHYCFFPWSNHYINNYCTVFIVIQIYIQIYNVHTRSQKTHTNIQILAIPGMSMIPKPTSDDAARKPCLLLSLQ